MARFFAVLALALFASAVLAEYIYSDEQIDEINDRLAQCLRQVPPQGDFNRPGDACRFEGIYALSEGAAKESITSTIVLCLVNKNVAAPTIAQAEQCLFQALVEPLTAA